MVSLTKAVLIAVLLTGVGVRAVQSPPTATAPQRIDLAERLTAGTLRVVNREISKLEGSRAGVHLSAKADVGLAWIDGTNFGDGTIEVDVKGRDVFQQSFVGIAFHGKDDTTYESVYVRPFNFRAAEPARHDHAVQYMVVPEFDWPQLRAKFPEEFENPVNASLSPTGWVPLRVVVHSTRVEVYVGADQSPTLAVRKLGALGRGLVGLWVGNNSDGDFANLRLTPAR